MYCPRGITLRSKLIIFLKILLFYAHVFFMRRLAGVYIRQCDSEFQLLLKSLTIKMYRNFLLQHTAPCNLLGSVVFSFGPTTFSKVWRHWYPVSSLIKYITSMSTTRSIPVHCRFPWFFADTGIAADRLQ